jgi:sugar phosphate isomerase/epimerase
MIRLAFSSNAFKKNTLDESIDCIAQIGYAGAELMADLHHAYPPAMDACRVARTREHLASRNLPVSNINAFTLFACGDTYHPTWIEADPERRRQRIEHTLNCIDLAGEFGAGTVSLQPGGPLIGRDLTRERASEIFAEGIARVLARAKEKKIVLAIEPEPGLLIESAGEYLEFKQRFFPDEPNVLMNCDVGHLFCVGDDPAEVIRRLPEHVAHVHVEDIGKNRVHQHLTPGKGVIDFAGVFAALGDIQYRGWVTVELYPYETTAAGVARRAFEHLAPMIGD